MKRIPNFFREIADKIDWKNIEGVGSGLKLVWAVVPQDEVWFLLYGYGMVTGTTPTVLTVYIRSMGSLSDVYLIRKASPTTALQYTFPTTQAGDQNLNASLIPLQEGDVIYCLGQVTSGNATTNLFFKYIKIKVAP